LKAFATDSISRRTGEQIVLCAGSVVLNGPKCSIGSHLMEAWLGSETSPAAVTNGKTPTLGCTPHGYGDCEHVGTATIERKGASPG
jgi:hypothetical protein